ncbi:MAG: permease, partial [Polyangiaceae bacterium]
MASGLGSLVGLGLIALSLLTHPVSRRIELELGLGSTLRALSLASAFPLVLALVASAVLRSFATERVITALRPCGAWTESARGVLVGALYPVCSCDVFALYRRVRCAGAPERSATALLVSAPEMELAAFTLSGALLGLPFALVRVASVAACGIMAGLIVGRHRPANTTSAGRVVAPLLAPQARFRRAIAFALGETVEHTGPWLILGLVVAALLEPSVEPGTLALVPAWFQVPACAVLGIVGYLCPSGVTPVVAVLVHKGLAPGAAVSFLLMSAAANVRVLRPLARVHGVGHTALYATTLLGSSIVLGGFAH